MTLQEFLQSKGFPAHPIDGQFYRFDRARKLSGSFHGKTETFGGRIVQVVKVMDWATDEKYTWKSTDGAALTPEEADAITQGLKEAEARDLAAREAEQEAVAARLLLLWDDAIALGTTEYLQRKHLPDVRVLGLRIDPAEPSTLLVPAYDAEGKLWNIQRILKDGSKYFTKGARVKGTLTPLGKVEDKHGTIYIAEGFATGASIHLATGSAVFSAFNSGNLARVASTVRARYPEARIVIGGDDDRWTTRPGGGPWNPGREAAARAEQACQGLVRLPVFSDLSTRPTDWNDLHGLASLDEVKRQLELPDPEPLIADVEESGPGTPDGEIDIPRLPTRQSRAGVPMPPTQQRVVDHLIDTFDGRLIKQGRDLFKYVGTHWKWLDQGAEDRLRVIIQRTCSGLGDVKFLDSVYKLLIYHLPSPPPGVDLFAPNPFCMNFSNGSLWIERGPDRAFSLNFRPHRREDYLVNVLPNLEYRAGDASENAEFLAMLDRVFEGDEDKAQRVDAIGEMFGAVLMPRFPQLFMLYGPAGTGKSTVLNIARRLAHPDNICSVDPSEFQGFNMESMAGKLVNIDTDIDLTAPIRDSMVKKIIDRQPFRIRRKGVKDLYSPLPSVHLFGGNGIPRTLDGASRAHDRRWTFIGFNAFVPKGNYDRDYWDYCFEVSPQGVLNFAVAGLLRLLAKGGHYTVPDSGRKKMTEWQDKSDIVGSFLNDIRAGELIEGNTQVKLGPDVEVSRAQLWLTFCAWFKECHRKEPTIGRTGFFEALRARKIVEKRTKSGWQFVGLRPEQSDGAKL